MTNNSFNNRSTKRGLISYDHLDELTDFFSKISEVADEYLYISATERRCFNLVSRFLPTLDNMVSNNGLLLQYKELATYFETHQRFPSILIIDDIMVHGRGISKLLCQLEQLILNELDRRNALSQAEQIYNVRRSFAHSIDIYVYAKNRGTLFLTDRFAQNITSWKNMYAGELRDLSLQLSDSLTRWEVANTCFVYSVRNPKLTDYLQSQAVPKEDTVDFDPQDQSKEKNPWIPINWNYSNEDMVQYLRLYGNDNVTRISTLRFVPSRSDHASPQITSFTIIGDLSKDILDRICDSVCNILNAYECYSLCSILSESHPLLQASRAQVINFIVSVIDFFDFCYNVLPANLLAILPFGLKGDLNKISCNFGKRNQLRRELSQITSSFDLQKKLASAIFPLLDEYSAPLVDISPKDCTYQKADGICNKYNRIVEEIFYYVGVCAEAQAYDLDHKPYLFRPETYQEYTQQFAKHFGDRHDLYGKDGVLSFSDFIKVVRRNYKYELHTCLYFYLAAYVALMDNGIMGVRLQYIPISHGDGKIITLSKAGEMATFHIPRLYSVFIPAFARVERRSYRVGLSEVKAILSFYSERNYEELEGDLDPKDIEHIKKTAPLLEMSDVENAIYNLYRCGQSFNGWNFKNLTYQNDPVLRIYQWLLEKKAVEFLGMFTGEN